MLNIDKETETVQGDGVQVQESGADSYSGQGRQVEEDREGDEMPGLAALIIGVIVSPGETMAALARNPRLAFPIIAMSLTMPLLYLVRYPLFKAFMQESMENSLAQQGVALPPEQLAAMMDWMPMVSIATAPVSVLIGWLFLTGIFFGLAKAMKGKGSFKQYLSVTGYAYVITMLYGLLSLALSFATGEIPSNTSLALFFPDMRGTYVYGLLRSIDLFTAWYYVVMAIGVAAASEIRHPRIYAAVAAVYLAMVVIGGFSARGI